MASTDKPPSTSPDHAFPAVAYPNPHFGGGTFPPPGPYPQYFAFTPPSDNNHPDGNQTGSHPPPFMIYPPGMIYAYPPHPTQNGPPSVTKPKRRQVKMACTNCATACKRCDEARPCERCVKYGITDSCVDGQRKERRKGIKRGPYKRRIKNADALLTQTGEGEWNPNNPTSTATTSAAIHAIAPFAAPPEGYHPYTYFYPPPGFVPPGHDGQPPSEGSSATSNGQPQMMPYFVHPSGYPAPYPYPPPGTMFHAPQTLDPAEANKKLDHAVGGGEVSNEEPGKKKAKNKTGEAKAKKAKNINGASQTVGRLSKGKKKGTGDQVAEPGPAPDAPA